MTVYGTLPCYLPHKCINGHSLFIRVNLFFYSGINEDGQCVRSFDGTVKLDIYLTSTIACLIRCTFMLCLLKHMVFCDILFSVSYLHVSLLVGKIIKLAN